MIRVASLAALRESGSAASQLIFDNIPILYRLFDPEELSRVLFVWPEDTRIIIRTTIGVVNMGAQMLR